MMGNDILIRPFRPEDQEAVRTLILAGLEEHWITLNPDKNRDLDDVASAYAGAFFLTAWKGGRLIGTGALVPRADGVAEIVRMSVASEMRRQGVGRRILRALCQQARQAGFRRIILETTSEWREVVAFYLKNGFRITHTVGGDTWFAKDIVE